MRKWIWLPLFVSVLFFRSAFAISDTSKYETPISGLMTVGDSGWVLPPNNCPWLSNGAAKYPDPDLKTGYPCFIFSPLAPIKDVSVTIQIQPKSSQPSGYENDLGIVLRGKVGSSVYPTGFYFTNSGGYDIVNSSYSSYYRLGFDKGKTFIGSNVLSSDVHQVVDLTAYGSGYETLTAEVIGQNYKFYWNGMLIDAFWDGSGDIPYKGQLNEPGLVGVYGRQSSFSPDTRGIISFQVSDASGFRKFVDHSYSDLVTGTAPASEENAAVNFLVGGFKNNNTFTDAANAIEGITNPLNLSLANMGVENLVSGWYNLLLRRAPDSGGLTYWAQALVNGTPSQAALASFLSSTEYQNYANQHQSGGQPKINYITQIYQDLLGRAPRFDEINYWFKRSVNAISAGVTHSTDFQTRVASCYIYNGNCWSTDPYYQNLLRQATSPSSTQVYNLLGTNQDLLTVAMKAVGSDDYFKWASTH